MTLDLIAPTRYNRDMNTKLPTWQERLHAALKPYPGHPLQPLPLRDNPARTEKMVTYVELEFARFIESYAARMGSRSSSEALRRLAIIGALAEGHNIEEEL